MLKLMSATRAVVEEQKQNGVRLGRIQEGVLRALLEHGGYPGSWVWDTHSHTEKVLESLAKRGLVQRTERPLTDHRHRPFPEGHPYHGKTRPVFTPTEAMKARVAEYAARYQRAKAADYARQSDS